MRYLSSRALAYWISSLAFDTKSTAFISPLLLRRAGFPQQAAATQVLATSMSETSNAFTSSRSIPKEETKILNLLQDYPLADGRGVKIAVLDTGCDLAAAGLQETSEGLPKYLDFLDCTGDGDIDTTATATIPEASSSAEDNSITVQGKSGRNLTLGEWAPKAGSQVRLGSIRLFDVIPRSVRSRLIRERKEVFLNEHHQLIAQTQQTLDGLQSKIDGCKADDKSDKDKKADEKKQLILQRNDAETLLAQYQGMIESYDDAGPYMDVVLFQDENDDNDYKVVIDLKADGNLTESIPFSAFAKKRQMGEFGFGSAVTFCIQIYDDGKTLSIVTDAGSHGTHVAGIAAANFGADNVKNGVAPGAQVLACKIGDQRLGSTETGTGLIRALIAAKKYDCDLVNLSYGEPSWQPDSGRVSEVFADATKKWGMTVFTSAGNDGPALSSLGSPGALSAPITVGAYVSSDMMVDQYSTLPAPAEVDGEEALRDASYYFSSRGPTPDGNLPDICAPGGAIAPIPRHSLQGKAQYHGTSMSSPNACGVAACVLSAVKQRLGITHLSPPELRKGLLNTASPVEVSDPFAQGAGLISAMTAVDYILENRGKLGQNLTVGVSIPSRSNARGLYIRDALELNGPMTFDVKVLPEFNHASTRTAKEMDELLSMELDLDLKPSETWVKCPERMSLMSAVERGGQTFSIRLAVDDLPPGVHYATIDGIDSTDVARGALFRLPVTVVKPHSAVVDVNNPTKSLNEHEAITLKKNGVDFSLSYLLEAGAPNRRFLEVPSIAEWVTFKIKSTNPNPSMTSPSRVLIHAIPFVRGDVPNTEIQLKKLIQVNEGYEKEFSMKVKGGSTLEVCLQLLWLANAASTSVVVDVEFHSLLTRGPTLVASQPVAISAGREFARFGAAANLRTEKLNPSASLNTVQRTLRPSSYNIISGSIDRDIMPPSDAEMKANADLKLSDGTEIYNMFLVYKFDIDSDKPIKVTPCVPSLFNQLYDSPLDSQIWELRDGSSQLLECGSSMHHSNTVSLEKGNYTITFHTRHPSRQVLEQMKDLPFSLLMSIDALDCKVYSELDKASTPSVTGDGRKEVGLKVLRKGSFQDLYVARPIGDLPSWVRPGDLMTGSVSLDKGKSGVTSMQLTYQVPPKSQVKKLNINSLPKDEEDEKTLDEIIFESKVSYLSTIRSKDEGAYKELSEKLLEENRTSIPLLSELLLFSKEAKLEGNDDSKDSARLKEIQKVRDLLPTSNGGPIDESALAQYYGVALPTEDDLVGDKDAAKLKDKMDQQKKLLKATLLALSDAAATLASSDSSQSDVFDSSVKELKKWAPFADAKDKLTYSMIISRHQRLCKGEKGSAIKTLMDARKDISTSEHYKKITEELLLIFESLEGTGHIIMDTKNMMYKRFPPK